MASHAAPNPRGNTVTLSVVQGESANPTATFSAAMAARMVTLGSGGGANWKLRAHGVEPLHAELYWDGTVLWVRNGQSVGGTYVGGERAHDWMQVFDGVEILVGSARIASRVVGPDARNPSSTNPAITSKNVGYIDEEDSTEVFSNTAALAAAAAVIRPMPSTRAPVPAPAPAPSASGNPRARMGTLSGPTASAPRSVSSAPAPAPAPAPRASPAPAPAPQASAGMTPARPASSEATVIRPSPYAAIEQAMGAPLPAAGNRNPMPNERTVAPGSLNTGAPSSVVLSASAVSLPVVSAQAARTGTMAPPVSATLQPVQPVQPVFGAQASFGPHSSPGIASPSSPHSSQGSYDDPFGPMDVPPLVEAKAAEKTVAGTSPRTLVLAGITLVIGLIAAILPPPHATQARRGGAQGPMYEVNTTPAPPPQTNNILQLPIGPTGLVGVIVPAPMQMTDPQGHPRSVVPPNPQDPIRLAAEAVAANRYADAVVLYERLAAEHPEAPLFRQFALVLRARLASMNCQPGAPGCLPPPAAPAAPAPAAPPSPSPSP